MYSVTSDEWQCSSDSGDECGDSVSDQGDDDM